MASLNIVVSKNSFLITVMEAKSWKQFCFHVVVSPSGWCRKLWFLSSCAKKMHMFCQLCVALCQTVLHWTRLQRGMPVFGMVHEHNFIGWDEGNAHLCCLSVYSSDLYDLLCLFVEHRVIDHNASRQGRRDARARCLHLRHTQLYVSHMHMRTLVTWCSRVVHFN